MLDRVIIFCYIILIIFNNILNSIITFRYRGLTSIIVIQFLTYNKKL